MPGLPLAVRETGNLGCSCNHSRTADQMCRQQSRDCLTAEEALTAEESLSVYCKPVELYNILQRRAIRNPSFLQRCLHYKIQAKRKRSRIQITISLCGNINAGVRAESVFPLFVFLGRPVGNGASLEHSSTYHVSSAYLLSTFVEPGRNGGTEAKFLIPEFKKFNSDVWGGDLNVILVSCGEQSPLENKQPKDEEDLPSLLSSLSRNCHCGKLQIDSLCSSLDKCMSLSLGHKSEILSTINMKRCIAEPSLLDKGSYLSFRTHNLDSMGSYQVQVNICAQELGATEKSPYHSYSYNDIPAASLSNIIRLRTGNVLFNYRYYNNTLQKTEVTEDFACPFCLVQCASFKGLRYHLTSSHDLFNFEFWVTEEYQAVNVSVRTDVWESEVISDGVDPRLETFYYRSKYKRRGRTNNRARSVTTVHPHILDCDSPEAGDGSHEDYQQRDVATCSSRRIMTYSTDNELPNEFTNCTSVKEDGMTSRGLFTSLSARHKSGSFCSENNHTSEFADPFASSSDMAGICAATAQNFTSNGCGQLVNGSSIAAPTMLQFAKSRKLSFERNDSRNRALLMKRQFFHSHRAQPMALEQVLSGRDSEDEVDDDIADFEDRRMLDDFVDVTKDEKQIMHLWNSFVRKQRVLADGHTPWACEAFTRLHGQDLVKAPTLLWCWRLFLVKLWNHSLLDARTINNCNLILEKFQSDSPDQKQS